MLDAFDCVSPVDAKLAKQATQMLMDKPDQKLKSGAEITEVLKKLGLIKHFTNMNILLFNSANANTEVDLSANGKLSKDAVEEMENSKEMVEARNEYLMMLFDVNNDGFAP